MWMFNNPTVKIQRIWRAILDDREMQKTDKKVEVVSKSNVNKIKSINQ